MLGTSEFTNPKESSMFKLEDVVYVDENRPNLHFLAGSETLDGWEEIANDIARNDFLNPFNDGKPKASQSHGYQTDYWSDRNKPKEEKSSVFGWMWKEEEEKILFHKHKGIK